ncbi:hypothetical protein GWI33_013133 [Rhynchophorus ferrugineus]|uniref:Uncharacterized protein n=1 Tax=Rhynchophorus ferrugineus TaxID=354439 RepID=A0A834I731_RHYFE|nr:hypothetical protein GWI33_013133 [Rhynchophorus ferrugineus]
MTEDLKGVFRSYLGKSFTNICLYTTSKSRDINRNGQTILTIKPTTSIGITMHANSQSLQPLAPLPVIVQLVTPLMVPEHHHIRPTNTIGPPHRHLLDRFMEIIMGFRAQRNCLMFQIIVA